MVEGLVLLTYGRAEASEAVIPGIANWLLNQGHRVACLRLVSSGDQPQGDLSLQRLAQGLGIKPSKLRVGVSREEFRRIVQEGRQVELYRQCLAVVDELGRDGSFVLVDATGTDAAADPEAAEILARLAGHLQLPTMPIVASDQGHAAGLRTRAVTATDQLHQNGAVVAALVLTDSSAVLAEVAEESVSPHAVPAVLRLPRRTAGGTAEELINYWTASTDPETIRCAVEGTAVSEDTPLRFLHQLAVRAGRDRRRIILPEAEDPRILQAAATLQQFGACHLILLSRRKDLDERARRLGISLTGVEVIDPGDPELVEAAARDYAQLRAHKGVTLEVAREAIRHPALMGTMLVHQGWADGMVCGAMHTTAETIRPALEVIRVADEASMVSSVFFMLLPDRTFVFGDCAINVSPTSQQLAEIAVASARTASQLGIEPRVALLSYSTGSSGEGEAVDKVRDAVEALNRSGAGEGDCEWLFDGPMQFDAAVNPDVAEAKRPDSAIAGRANVLIFPELEAGNIAYKAVQQSAGATAVGPVLQGLNKPVNDLSRGCTVDDVVNTVLITAIQAA